MVEKDKNVLQTNHNSAEIIKSINYQIKKRNIKNHFYMEMVKVGIKLLK